MFAEWKFLKWENDSIFFRWEICTTQLIKFLKIYFMSKKWIHRNIFENVLVTLYDIIHLNNHFHLVAFHKFLANIYLLDSVIDPFAGLVRIIQFLFLL